MPQLELTLGVQGKNSLDGYVDASEVVLFEHDINHPFSVPEWVHRWFGQEDFAAVSVYFHLLVEGVIPEMLHVIPSLYDAILHLPPRTISNRLPT